MKRFTCVNCGSVELRKGGTAEFHCGSCRVLRGKSDLSSPKYMAHQAVAKARARGSLPDPKTCKCADCGVNAIEYDHRDYAKPLDVAPVCRRCNLRRGPALNSTNQPKQQEA